MATPALTTRLDRLRQSNLVDLIGYALLALVGVWLVGNFIKDPTEFINVGLIGLTNGAIYGLVALGYTLVYGILQLINFAHGDVFALSGLVASTMIVSVLGLDNDSSNLVIVGGMLLTLVIIMAMFSIINASIEFVAYKPLRRAPRLAALITAVGMSFIVQNVSLALYGVRVPLRANHPPHGGDRHRRHHVLLEQGCGVDHHHPRADPVELVRRFDNAPG